MHDAHGPDAFSPEEILAMRMRPEMFAYLNDPQFVAHRMAQDVGKAISKMVRSGKGGYILVEAPPRHGKSMLISHKTPVWFLSLDPTKHVAVTTYEANFSASWGAKIRDDINDYGAQYGLEIRNDSRGKGDFKLTAGGSVFCTGIGGPLTGRGFHLLLIDDPVKNAEEAASPTIREKHWEWWQSTASTRLEPGAVVVFMLTRWNEDDLAGRVLKAAREDPSAPQWVHLRYPAICESEDDLLGREIGEPLWPQRYDIDKLLSIKARSGAYYWAAMFQQRPAPLEGGMFERSWFTAANQSGPAHMPRVRAWDLAGGAKRTNDYTAGVLLARSPTSPHHVRIEDINRFKGRPHDVEEEVMQTALEDGPSVIIQLQQDPGQAGAAQIERYQRLLRGYPLSIYKPTGEKWIRAQPLSAKAQAGYLEYVVASWNDAFFDEAGVFPNGLNDDMIDAASAGLQLIETMAPRTFFHTGRDELSDRRDRTARLIADTTPGGGRRRSNFRGVLRRW